MLSSGAVLLWITATTRMMLKIFPRVIMGIIREYAIDWGIGPYLKELSRARRRGRLICESPYNAIRLGMNRPIEHRFAIALKLNCSGLRIFTSHSPDITLKTNFRDVWDFIAGERNYIACGLEGYIRDPKLVESYRRELHGRLRHFIVSRECAMVARSRNALKYG